MMAIGNFPAFIYIWAQVLVIIPMGHVIKSLTVAEYMADLVLVGECGRREMVKRLIAAAVIGNIF